MKKVFLNFGLIILSSVLFLLFMEIVSRIFLKSVQTHVVNKDGEIVSMQVEPGNPAAGLIPYFDGRMVSGEFDVSIRLNSQGLRENVEFGGDNHGEPLQVILLGDSFMFGWGVEFNQSFASHLAKYLSTFTKQKVVVNTLAVPGTGQLSQLAILKRVSHPAPDIILTGMYLTDHVASGHDLIENLNEFHQFKSHSSKTQLTDDDNSKLDRLRQIRRWLKRHSNLFRYVETRLGAIFLAKFSRAIHLESDPQVMESAWTLTDSILVELKESAREIRALFAIQYIPNMLDVIQNNLNPYDRLSAICDQRGIPIAPNPIELFNPSVASGKISDYYYTGDGHWTTQAHEVAARFAAKFIAENIIRNKSN
ncbi:MAG: hypothetical protein ACE5HS_22190 [bacterium]